jgi:hypothetical protein
MKVQEKGTDRRAELHMHVQEKVEELTEYGQYIDPDDQAICCYVPVEEGNIIKIAGKLHGTVSITRLLFSNFTNCNRPCLSIGTSTSTECYARPIT